MGYVIIPKPIFLGREGMNSRLTGRWRSTLTSRCFIQINTLAGDSVSAIVFGCFSPIQKLLGRTEMRTCERKECQSIRTVSD